MQIWLLISTFWMQSVAYRITASLDSATHTLTVQETLHYVNRSPDTLAYVWFHLYPLAFRPGSVFDREARRAGNFRLARSDSAAWTRWTWERVVAGKVPCDSGGRTACRMQRVDTELRLILPEPLAPGDTYRFVFAYTLRLPRIFSRMGWQGRDMVITQWYPKPAVYDAVPPKRPPLDLPDSLYQGRTGFWHPDGYHFRGEFYGEFGSFRVRISVPEGYTVAATGVQVSADTLEDSTGTRICREYQADSVHDFAWVASPDWVVMDTLYRRIHLVIYAKKRRQALYDTLRRELPLMFERLEAWYGPYPYPVFRVVDGPLAAGGGMEYPMLVIVAPPHGFKRLYGLVGFTRMERLRTVTVHELAHQWFYGILANNELDEPWLDESWTSDAEKRYMAWWHRTHPQKRSSLMQRMIPDPSLPTKIWHYHYINSDNNEPLAAEPAYRMKAYGATIYGKGQRVVAWIRDVLGDSAFLAWMTQYRRAYTFRHVHIRDLRTLFAGMGYDPGHLLDPWMTTPGLEDVRFGQVRRTPEGVEGILVRTGASVPITVGAVTDEGDTLTQVVWGDRFAFRGKIRTLLADVHDALPEVNEWNNRWPHRAVRWGVGVPPPLDLQSLWVYALPGVVYTPLEHWMPGLLVAYTQGTVHHTGAVGIGYASALRLWETFGSWEDGPTRITWGSWPGSADGAWSHRVWAREWGTGGLRWQTTFAVESVWDSTLINPVVYQSGIRHVWENRFTFWYRTLRGRFGGTAAFRLGRWRGKGYARLQVDGRAHVRAWRGWTLRFRIGVLTGDAPRVEQFWLEGEPVEPFPWSLLIPSTGDWAVQGKFLTVGPGMLTYSGEERYGPVQVWADVRTRMFWRVYGYGAAGQVSPRVRDLWPLHLEAGLLLPLGPLEVGIPLWRDGDSRITPRFRVRVPSGG